MGETGFEPGTSAPEVWCAANEPLHISIVESAIASFNQILMVLVPRKGLIKVVAAWSQGLKPRMDTSEGSITPLMII